jgi:hypothetical protein
MRSEHHGLNFESPFAIGQPTANTCPLDVTVRLAPAAPVTEEAPGPAVARSDQPNVAGYTVYSVAGGYVFRFHGLCEFEVGADGGTVRCVPGPDCREGYLPILMEGALTAFLLTLRGFAVLHASALQWGNDTFLIAGRSGMGKSTVAALCCAVGGKFISDDVVALAQGQDGVCCVGRGNKLRLRKQASEIADLFPSPVPDRSLTADGRLAITPERALEERHLVRAVVLPRPTRDSDKVAIEALGPLPAMTHLLANARISGMVPAEMQRTLFQTVSALAIQAPVIEAQVPWGPPFSTDVAEELLEQLEIAAQKPKGRAGLRTIGL